MALWLKSVNGSYELLKRGRKKEEGREREREGERKTKRVMDGRGQGLSSEVGVVSGGEADDTRP